MSNYFALKITQIYLTNLFKKLLWPFSSKRFFWIYFRFLEMEINFLQNSLIKKLYSFLSVLGRIPSKFSEYLRFSQLKWSKIIWIFNDFSRKTNHNKIIELHDSVHFLNFSLLFKEISGTSLLFTTFYETWDFVCLKKKNDCCTKRRNFPLRFKKKICLFRIP
jgi:hypothetical protein